MTHFPPAHFANYHFSPAQFIKVTIAADITQAMTDTTQHFIFVPAGTTYGIERGNVAMTATLRKVVFNDQLRHIN